jgi:hypothetical protein
MEQSDYSMAMSTLNKLTDPELELLIRAARAELNDRNTNTLKFVAQVGLFKIETNGSGEVFLTVRKTMLRLGDVGVGGIRVTFSSPNGSFIPNNINGLPAMIFEST